MSDTFACGSACCLDCCEFNMGQLRIFIFALFSLVGASTTFFMGRREYYIACSFTVVGASLFSLQIPTLPVITLDPD
jgi:hypothetical protein